MGSNPFNIAIEENDNLAPGEALLCKGGKILARCINIGKSGMEIKPGFYKTRDGRKARVTCTDAPGCYPVSGYIHRVGNGLQPQMWVENGSSLLCGSPNDDDLVSEWRDPVKVSGWIPVYTDYRQIYYGELYPTEQDALRVSENSERIAVVYVEGEEGKEP